MYTEKLRSSILYYLKLSFALEPLECSLGKVSTGRWGIDSDRYKQLISMNNTAPLGRSLTSILSTDLEFKLSCGIAPVQPANISSGIPVYELSPEWPLSEPAV